jgi:hypothetical protein
MLKLITLLFVFGVCASAHSTFTLPSSTCPLAHCSIYAGNRTLQAPPTPMAGTVNRLLADSDVGETPGLGCSTNGTVIACTYQDGLTNDPNNGNAAYCPKTVDGTTVDEPKDTLVIYNTSGTALYKSGCLLGPLVWTSAPLIDTNGDVIVMDDTILVSIKYTSGSYPSTGTASICTIYSWSQPYACGGTVPASSSAINNGSVFSPVLLANGTMIAFASAAPGYVFAFYADDLTYVAVPLNYSDSACNSVNHTWETKNTVAASHTATNRFYVSMNAYRNFSGFPTIDGCGELIAFEANPAGTIDFKWGYPFNGPSGASPVVLPVADGSNSDIFFDGFGNSGDSRLIKITDTGTTYTFRWTSNMGDFAARIPASVTVDNLNTRNCVWAFALFSPNLNCVNTGNTYNIDNTINVGGTMGLVPGGLPASELTISYTSGGDAVLIMSLEIVGSGGHVTAVKVTGDVSTSNFTPTKYWDTAYPASPPLEFSPTQFPIVTTVTNSSGTSQSVAAPSLQKRM